MSDSKLIAFLLALLFATFAFVSYRYWQPQTLDRAQGAFELSEPRWNWQGWHEDGSLVCRDKGDELRSCRVFISLQNGAFGETRQKLAIFSCNVQACAWVLEP